MDYSVHDAIKAGYNQILFVINKNIESAFLSNFGNNIFSICHKHNIECHYVLELVEDVPAGITYPESRLVPWGTGQAVLACKKYLSGPFAVINADDFYGFNALKNMKMNLCNNSLPQYFMTGYRIINTVPSTGTVNRGICKIDNDRITDIRETPNIILETDKSTGCHYISADGQSISNNSFVNMNLWGFPEDFLEILDLEFKQFFIDQRATLANAEFLLPVVMGKLVRENRLCLNLIQSEEECFGLTRQADMQIVREKISHLVNRGVYLSNLYDDL